MREIKFRAWDIENKCWRTVYRFEYITHKGNESIQVYESWQDDEDGISYICELMQFIGLKDKNDKDIYEGDIINYCGNCYNEVVKMPESYESLMGWTPSEIIPEVIVIGNIYKNPELLK